MASSKNRQRALARAKVERQIARRAAAGRRRRQILGAVGAGLIVVLVAVSAVWATGGFSRHKSKTTATGTECAWTTPQDASTNTNLKNVGRPPTTNLPNQGTETMTITTNLGVVSASIDLAKAPCTAASFTYLAGKGFFIDTKCHRLTTSGIFVLQCGDPSGTGNGGPTYKFPDEYKPVAAAAPSASGAAPSPSAAQSAPALYPKGSLAMANSGPDTNGSQFFIVYKDTQLPGDYTLFGTVTSGIDVVEKVAAAGVDGGSGDGKPKTEVQIKQLLVSAPASAAQPPAGNEPPPPNRSGASPSTP